MVWEFKVHSQYLVFLVLSCLDSCIVATMASNNKPQKTTFVVPNRRPHTTFSLYGYDDAKDEDGDYCEFCGNTDHHQLFSVELVFGTRTRPASFHIELCDVCLDSSPADEPSNDDYWITLKVPTTVVGTQSIVTETVNCRNHDY